MKIIFIVSIAMNVIFQGGMRYYMLLIRILQLILHLPIFHIMVPGNVSMLFQILIPIVTFDIISEEKFRSVMKFDPDGELLVPSRF